MSFLLICTLLLGCEWVLRRYRRESQQLRDDQLPVMDLVALGNALQREDRGSREPVAPGTKPAAWNWPAERSMS